MVSGKVSVFSRPIRPQSAMAGESAEKEYEKEQVCLLERERQEREKRRAYKYTFFLTADFLLGFFTLTHSRLLPLLSFSPGQASGEEEQVQQAPRIHTNMH